MMHIQSIKVCPNFDKRFAWVPTSHSRIQGLQNLLFHEYTSEIFNHYKLNYSKIEFYGI